MGAAPDANTAGAGSPLPANIDTGTFQEGRTTVGPITTGRMTGGPRRGAGKAALAAALAGVILLTPVIGDGRARAAGLAAAARPVFPGPGYRVVLPAGWAVRQRTELAVEVRRPDGRAAIDIYTQPLPEKSFGEFVTYSNKFVFAPRGALTVLAAWPADFWAAYGYAAPSSGSPSGAAPVPAALPPVPGACVAGLDWVRPAADIRDLNRVREVNYGVPGACYTFVLTGRELGFAEAAAALDSMLATFEPAPLPADPAGEWLARRAAAGASAGAAVGLPVPEFRYAGPKRLHVQLPPSGLVWGMFDGNAPYDLGPLKDLEAYLKWHFDFVMTYRDFSAPFPLEALRAAALENRLCMITWQQHFIADLDGPPLIPAIVAGDYDAYIRGWAEAVREFGQPVLLRFANEMNGDWDPWCAFYYGFDHDLFIRAWRRVHDIFAAAGAENALWVWNPHDRSYPGFAWNDPHLYYPGGCYVDWVGLTGYNTGPRAGDPWRSFEEIYRPVYDRYRALYPQKPLLITEFACDTVGGDKAAWIRDAFQALKGYPAIKLAVWFNFPWWQWEYELGKPPAALDAFGGGLLDPYFSTSAVFWWPRGFD